MHGCARGVLKGVVEHCLVFSFVLLFHALAVKAATTSPGFAPSPGFPEASPAKAKSLVASHLMMHVA